MVASDNIRGKILIRTIILIIIFTLITGDMYQFSQEDQKDLFVQAVNKYISQDYGTAILQLETALFQTKDNPEVKVKILFMLGACFEQMGYVDKAREHYLKVKDMYDKKVVTSFFSIEGIDIESLKEYQAVIKGETKKEKEKRNIIEKKGKFKPIKNARFPWTLIGILAAVVAVGLYFTLKPRGTEIEEKNDPYHDIEWVRVPAGEFKMGDNFNEGELDERPVHTVYLNEYYISKYEITFEQFDKFCDETGRTKPEMGKVDSGSYIFWGRGKMPVINVTWEDAKAYCDWLSQTRGENIHLPTEAQWEKAARGTDQRRYPWGNSQPTDLYANDFPDFDLGVYTRIVGSFPLGQSPYGLYDMAGNVEEWCLDWYNANYYQNSPPKNPKGPSGGVDKVSRGGCYDPARSHSIRSADRNMRDPSLKYDYVGFRLVKEY